MSQSRDELERERDELDRKMVRDAAKWQDRLNLMHDQVLTAQAERDEARRQTEEACEQFAKMRDSRDEKQIERDEARAAAIEWQEKAGICKGKHDRLLVELDEARRERDALLDAAKLNMCHWPGCDHTAHVILKQAIEKAEG